MLAIRAVDPRRELAWPGDAHPSWQSVLLENNPSHAPYTEKTDK